MTAYTNTSPAANQVLATSQGLMLDNFNYTYLTLGVDHNVTVKTNTAQNGYHTIIHYVDQGGAPATIPGTGQLYTKTISGDQQLFYKTGGGTEIQVTAGAGPTGISVRAAVSFQGRPNDGACVLNYSTNVLSVSRTGGLYVVTYSGGGLGTANYYCSLISLSADTNFGQLAVAQTATTATLRFTSFTFAASDPTTAQFVVYF